MITVLVSEDEAIASAYGYISTEEGNVDVRVGDMIAFTCVVHNGKRSSVTTVSVNGINYQLKGESVIHYY